MLPVGRLNKNLNSKGFTLLELIVVISLVCTFLFFSFPLLSNKRILKNRIHSDTDIHGLAGYIETIKNRSVQNRLNYFLSFDTDEGSIWTRHEAMDPEQVQKARDDRVLFSDRIRIVDIKLYGKTASPSGTVPIAINKNGYSNYALIHCILDDQLKTIRIEPFLTRTEVIDGHVEFETCIQ